MIRAIASIHHRMTKRGVIQYRLHFTFSAPLTEILGWKAKDTLLFFIYQPGGSLNFYKAKPQDQDIAQVLTLGRYRNRPGSLWINYPILGTFRRSFLKHYGNGVSSKLCWTEVGMFVNNGNLTLHGRGKTFKKGIIKRKHK